MTRIKSSTSEKNKWHSMDLTPIPLSHEKVEGKSVRVLVFSKSSGILAGVCWIREYFMDKDDFAEYYWSAYYSYGLFGERTDGDITHWMYMPGEPKTHEE